ncbi:MAG: DUF4079 domain-containing protein [Elainellaceae cyanobacterium]
MSEYLIEFLEPIANWFRSLGVPEPIVHWGHPAMMGVVVFVMGSFVGLTGWRGREVSDKTESAKSLAGHRKMAPLMFLFIVLGYTGGVLSLIMQKQPVFDSPHFWTGSLVILLLGVNAAIAATGFGKGKSAFRTIHAYLGGTALCVMFLHAVLGFKLGLAI